MKHPAIDDPYPTNADLKRSFDEHARHDEKFKQETRVVDKDIQDTLKEILGRLSDIDKKIEDMGASLKTWEEVRDGLIFGRKALLWTAGIIIALGSIVGGIIGFIRFVK